MDIFETDDNSTPLTAEEKDGLKLKWITLRSELNEAEARNIAQAQIWLMSNKKKISIPILSYVNCIKKCLAMYGSGLEHTEHLKEISVWHLIRFR